jgi:AcrR family transcriptional regulator
MSEARPRYRAVRRRPPPPRPRRRPGRRPRAADAGGTRQRLVAAAAVEFAARGFAGASVDRIARTARVNKAMIYYHFPSKAALYRDILRDMFRAVSVRVRAVAESDRSPHDKIRGFVEAIAAEAEARPHFPPIWFREIADGGAHLDEDTLADITGIVKTLGALMHEGVRAGRFQPVNLLLVHGGIVGPLLLYFASAGLRQRIERAGLDAAAQFTRDVVVAHVQRVTLDLLEGHRS